MTFSTICYLLFPLLSEVGKRGCILVLIGERVYKKINKYKLIIRINHMCIRLIKFLNEDKYLILPIDPHDI